MKCLGLMLQREFSWADVLGFPPEREYLEAREGLVSITYVDAFDIDATNVEQVSEKDVAQRRERLKLQSSIMDLAQN